MFYDNLKLICDKKGVKITPIVAECGGAKGSISNWKNGASPNSDIVAKLSVRLNVSTDMLIFGEEKNSSTELSEDEQELLGIFKKLPEKQQARVIERAQTLAELFGERNGAMQNDPYGSEVVMTTIINVAEVAAGAGISTPFTIDNVFTPKEFPKDVVPKGADCGVPINGDSMEPDYPNGSIVWVKETQDVKYGDVVIAILNGEPFCKIYQSDGLYSINKGFPPIMVTENDSFSVFGKVIGYYVE